MKDEPSKAGRPARAGEVSLSKIEVRMTKEEKIEWTEISKKSGAKNLSAWIRELVEEYKAA